MVPALTDTHAHYYDRAYGEDRDALLCTMHHEGVGRIVMVSAEPGSLAKVREMTERYGFVFGTQGLHPDEAGSLTEETEREIRDALRMPKIVAVGEIGLDYYWNKEEKEVQEAAFRRQIAIAKDAGKPVVIHSREAAADTMRVLEEETAPLARAVAEKRGEPDASPGVMHCYSYALPDAVRYTEMGYYLGIGGVVTYKNAKKLKEVVREIPLGRLVLETDAPYLSPQGHRGERNDSRYLFLVAEEIASIKGITAEEVVLATAENAKRLFDLP